MPGLVWSVQAHPEFTEFIMGCILEARHDNGVFDDELYQDGKSRAGKQTDGEKLGENIVRFILKNCK